MTEPGAEDKRARDMPRLELRALRGLRCLLDAVLLSSDVGCLTGQGDDHDKNMQSSPETTEPVRCATTDAGVAQEASGGGARADAADVAGGNGHRRTTAGPGGRPQG